jgi:membrane-associated phospholipid phosphatase
VPTIVVAIWLAVVMVPFGLVLLLISLRWTPLLRTDVAVDRDVHGIAVDNHGFVRAMEVVTFAGSTAVWLVVFVAVVAWLLVRRQPRLAAFAATAAVTSWLINNLVKATVRRLRPVLPDPVAHAPGFSFPSGHAQAAASGYLILLVVFMPTLSRAGRYIATAVAVVLVAAIGFSRIALGVHFLTDVVAGYALGAAWVAAMVVLFDVWPAPGRHEQTTERDA